MEHHPSEIKEMITVFETSTVYATVMVTSTAEPPAMSPSCHEIKVALGCVAGLFIAIVVMVTIGCIFIWWNMKKKGRMKISSGQTRYDKRWEPIL